MAVRALTHRPVIWNRRRDHAKGIAICKTDGFVQDLHEVILECIKREGSILIIHACMVGHALHPASKDYANPYSTYANRDQIILCTNEWAIARLSPRICTSVAINQALDKVRSSPTGDPDNVSCMNEREKSRKHIWIGFCDR